MVLPGYPRSWEPFPILLISLEEQGIEWPVPAPPGGPRGGPVQPPIHPQYQGEGFAPWKVGDRVLVPDQVVPGLRGTQGPHRSPCRPCPLPLRLLRRCRAGRLRRWGGGHPRWFRLWLPCRGGGVVQGAAVRAGRRLVGGLGG